MSADLHGAAPEGLLVTASALSAAVAVLLAGARPARGRPPPAGPLESPVADGAASTRSPLDGSEPSGGSSPLQADGRQGIVRLAAALAAAATGWTFVPGITGAVAALVAAVATWRWSGSWEPAAAKRRRALLESELPWLVDHLGSALRAGLGPVEALLRVAEVSRPEVRRELQVPLARLRLGVDPVSVWEALAGHPELGRLGVALRRATESGAPVLGALERLAADLRAGRLAAVQVRVRRIEVRAAIPLGVCLLPAFVLLAVVPLVAGSASRLLGG